MAHPFTWPTYSFYPIGDTPPICLTQSLPPEANARVLLLGCGDPRNILYTMYMDRQSSTPGVRRELDVTCCDIEPAVLARNILLFTLIVDDSYPETFSQIWNIFYHFFLDKSSADLLWIHCNELARLSVDMETWNHSQYASFMRISSNFTLLELNRMWNLYAKTEGFTELQAEDFTQKFKNDIKRVSRKHAADAPKNRTYRHYWETGVMTEAQNIISAASFVNPTFAYTSQSEDFNAHFTTCPVSAFHVSHAFQLVSKRNALPTPTSLAALCRSHLRSWCDATRAVLKDEHGGVVLRFLASDALAICQSLRDYRKNGRQTTYECVTPMDATLLVLDPSDHRTTASHPAPVSYNVIDTSNLADSLGLLNILIAASPLLSRDAFAVLNTESKIEVSQVEKRGKDLSSFFAERLCCHPYTLFTLLDLVSVDCLSGFSSRSNLPKALSSWKPVNNVVPAQRHERLTWKVLSALNKDETPPVLSMDPPELSNILFCIYLQMFSYENNPELWRRNPDESLWRSQVHYCRRSFALLIRTIMENISTNGRTAFSHLLTRIYQDQTLMLSQNFFRDLLYQFHILGIYSDTDQPLITENQSQGRFRSWKTLPSMVCVMFSMPPDYLHALAKEGSPSLPLLTVQIAGQRFNNNFSSPQMAWGELSVKGNNDDARATIIAGNPGDCSIIVYIWIPTWALSREPTTTDIILSVLNTPTHSRLVTSLGLDMTLFKASLTDVRRLHITCQAPLTQRDIHIVSPSPSIFKPIAPSSHSGSTLSISLDKSGQRISSICSRIGIKDTDMKVELSNPETKVDITLVAPNNLRLVIGSMFGLPVTLPLTAELQKARIRIARRSSWVEVIVPIQETPIGCRDILTVHSGDMVIPWNIHYVNLDYLLALANATVKRLPWFYRHLLLELSDAENQVKDRGLARLHPLSQVKETIRAMVLRFSDHLRAHEHYAVFGLHRVSAELDTIMIVNALRLDPEGQTVILDVYILPLDERTFEEVYSSIQNIRASRAYTPFTVTDEALTAWKSLIPACVERCRTWVHRSDCAYRREGNIPLSTQHRMPVICACGCGTVTNTFKARADPEWTPLIPHLTRAAISLLFPTACLESVSKTLERLPGSEEEAATQEHRSIKKVCATCGRQQIEKLHICSACKTVYYCNGECQTAGWEGHKKMCLRVQRGGSSGRR